MRNENPNEIQMQVKFKYGFGPFGFFLSRTCGCETRTF